MIKCRMCGKMFKVITTNGHLKLHKITSKQYKAKYPGAPVFSQVVKHKMSEASQKNIKSGKHFVPFRDIPGLAKRIISGNHSSAIRRSWVSRKGDVQPEDEKREYICKNCGITVYCIPYRATRRLFCNRDCWFDFKKTHHTWSKQGVRDDLGHFVRSTWEADVCRIIKLLGGAYGYEELLIHFKKGSHTRRYKVDIVDYDRVLSEGYIEVKGWFNDKDRDKMDLVKNQHSEFFSKLRFIMLPEMKELALKYKHRIPNWESDFPARDS